MPKSRVSAVDPVFAEIAKAIYGDVDPREILKSGGAAAPTGNPEKDKKIAQTGLAATGVATAGVGHALTASWNEQKHRTAAARGETYTPKPLGPRAAKLKVVRQAAARKVGLTPKRAALAAGIGYGALHGVEAVSDGLAIHAQTKALRQANAQIADRDKKKVAKAFRLKPLNSLPDQVPSLRAKRARRTPMPANPHTKAGLYQPVSKGVRAVYRGVKQTASNIKDTTTHVRDTASHAERAAAQAQDTVRNVSEQATRTAGHAEDTARHVSESAAKVKRLIPTPRTAALMGAGAVAALSGATYAGTRAGAHAGTRPARKKEPKKPVRKSVETDVTWSGVFSKVDADKRQVFGWASVSKLNGEDVVDLQGDIVPIEETEKAAYRYVIESRKGGDMHRRVSKLTEDEPLHTADMIESFVVTPEKLEKMGLAPDALPHGWWVGYHVNDDAQWAMVKSGERAGFSIHGSGTRTAVSKRDDGPKLKDRVEQATHPPKVALTPVKSAAITAMGYQRQTRRLAVEMQSRQGQPYEYRMKPKAARAALDAPSLGHHYATQVRGKAKRAKRYTTADRARLFVNPQVSKRLVPIGKAHA